MSGDGGATWSTATSGSTARLRTLRMRDANTGWAAGDGGTLLATGNGGASWTAQPVAGSPQLAGLSVAGTADAWAVGAGCPGASRPRARAPRHPARGQPADQRRLLHVQGQHCVWEQAASLANQPDGGVVCAWRRAST